MDLQSNGEKRLRNRNHEHFQPVVWFLLVSVFVVHLASYMVIPFMMVLLPLHAGISIAMAALVVFVIKISVKLSNVVGGPLADRFGTKPLMVIGMILRGLGMLAFVWNPHVWWLFLASLVAGLGNGLYSPPTRAAISFLSPASARRKAFSARAVAANLGMALAPVVVFLLAKGYEHLVFVGSGVLFLVFAAITWLWLPDLPRQQEASLGVILKEVARHRRWMTFCLLVIGSWFLYGQIDSNVVVWTNGLFGIVGMTATSMFFALCVALMQAAETRYGLARRLSSGQYVVVGTALLTLALFMVSVFNSLFGAGIAVLFFAAGATLLTPGQDLVTSEMARPGRENTYFAAATLSSSIGTAVSAPIGVLLIQHSQSHWIPWVVMAMFGLFTTFWLFQWARNSVGTKAFNDVKGV